MDSAAHSVDSRPRGSRWRALIFAAVLCLSVGLMAVLLQHRDGTRVGTSAVDVGGGKSISSGWTRLPDPPLSPRTGASAAWTGEEVVVAGGWTFLCPPGAGCASPTEAPFTDGAAFNPSTRTWRPIVDSPAAFQGEHPAVTDGGVFFLVDCGVQFARPGVTPAEDRCPQSDESSVLLRYEPGLDTWAQLAGPPGDVQYTIEAVGASIIAFASTEERGERPEWRFDLAVRQWTELPDDPLPRMYDRSIVAADGGRSLLFFGANAEKGPTSEPSREVNLAARLDLDTMRWTVLPSSPSRGYRAWGIDDAVVLEPHFGGTGGLFEPASATWSALTTGDAGSVDSKRVAGAFGRSDAVYVDVSGWVFDLEHRGWFEIKPIDGRSVFPNSSVVAVGRDLFSFGGERWSSPAGELLGDAWMWSAPGL